MEKLRLYLNGLSLKEQTRFAISCLTTIGYLRKAISKGQVIGPETCVLIEKESGGAVTRKDLHPDDWQSIWPELADKPVNKHNRTYIRRAAERAALEADRRNRGTDK